METCCKCNRTSSFIVICKSCLKFYCCDCDEYYDCEGAIFINNICHEFINKCDDCKKK